MHDVAGFRLAMARLFLAVEEQIHSSPAVGAASKLVTHSMREFDIYRRRGGVRRGQIEGEEVL